MEDVKIATILINYNGYEDTADAINSIEKSSVKTDIIVVDNASDQNEGDKLKEAFSDIYVIQSKENVGFSGGNNLGIKYALNKNYEYIMLLNNDTVISNKMIENLLKYASDHTVVSPLMYYYTNKKKIWFAGGDINRFTGNTEHYMMNCIEDKQLQNTKCAFLTGCCMMIHTNIIKKVGLLDETYFMYCEDTDFSIRLKRNGFEMLMVPEAKLWHKVSSSTGGDESAFSLYYMTRNRLNYVKKYRKDLLPTAYAFSIITRYIRAFQYKMRKNENWKTIRKAIKDHKRNISGKTDLYR